MPNVKRRRLRLYDIPPRSPESERLRIEHLAQREFQLTYGLKHDGIAVPLDFKRDRLGPALVFDYEESELPLDVYLQHDGAQLSLELRVKLATGLVLQSRLRDVST